MPRSTPPSRRQLLLYRERELQYAPPDDLRAEIVKVLANLLLEALGEPTSTQTIGGGDESEDHA
jgi:hypothetical protein